MLPRGLELVGYMVVCDDMVGTTGSVKNVWNQGKAESASMEGKDHALLDRSTAWSDCRIRNNGIAESIVPRRRVG